MKFLYDLLITRVVLAATPVGTVDVESHTPTSYVDVGRLVANLYTTLVIVSGIATFLYLALGGFQYITSGGDKAAVEQARNKITYSLMGLAIVVGAYAFGFILQNTFGVAFLGGVLWPQP